MGRTAEHEIDPRLLARWSPRAMSGAPVEESVLRSLFEAARWAPSGGNTQSWRFVFARADTPHFERFHDLLTEGNRPWNRRAAALIVVAPRTRNDQGQPLRSHAFDAGAACLSMALEADRRGLVFHTMGGFDRARAKTDLSLPEEFEPVVMCAVGHPGDVALLDERDRVREQPSGREPQSTFVREGSWS